MNTITVLW